MQSKISNTISVTVEHTHTHRVDMPLLDGDDKVVGLVLREDEPTGSYVRSYLVLDFSTHKLKMYPEVAEFEIDLSTCTIEVEINCQYITKVSSALDVHVDVFKYHL